MTEISLIVTLINQTTSPHTTIVAQISEGGWLVMVYRHIQQFSEVQCIYNCLKLDLIPL